MCRILVVPNAYKKEEKWLFLKDALWGGGGTHRSWPGGRGGRPRALIPGGEGVREGLAWQKGQFLTLTKWLFLKDALWGGRGGTHRSWPGGRGGRPRALIPAEGVREGLKLNSWLGGRGVREAGQGPGGGCKGFGSGGANFATCVVFLLFLTRTKRRKMAFLKDALWGGGGYPPELAWWTGG